MQIDDLLVAVAENTRRIKEHVSEEGPEEINPLIEAWRGDDAIAIVTLRDHQRNEILATAAACAAGFDADAMSIAFEGYAGIGTAFRSPNTNPMTGKHWRDQEMQEVVEHHDGLAKKWVTETIVVNVVNRAGDLASMFQPFSYADGAIVWGRSRNMSTLDPNWKNRGLMPEAMIKMMMMESGGSKFPYGDDPVERSVRDARTAQILTSERRAVALWSNRDDSDRIDVISKIGVVLE